MTLKSRALQGRDTIWHKYWLKMSALWEKRTCSFASCLAWHSSGRGGRGQKKRMKPMGIIHFRLLLDPPCTYFGAAYLFRCLPSFLTYASTNFRTIFLALLIKHMQFVLHLKVGPYRGEIQYDTNIGLKCLLCEKKDLQFCKLLGLAQFR